MSDDPEVPTPADQPNLELLTFIVDRVNVGIFVVDRDLNVGLWNKFMVTHSGKLENEVVGENICDVFPDLPKRWFKKKVDSVFMLKNMAFTSWEQRSFLFKFPHNRPITGGVEFMYQDFTLTPMKDNRGEVKSVVVTLYDSTDTCIYKKAHEDAMARLQIMSQIDGLTQLNNRAHWEKRLSDEVERARRYGGILTLMMFDLDFFKKVNDNYGHLAGDEVLKKISEIVKESLRENDVPGRYGGEEFGIILPATDVEGGVVVADRIRSLAEESFVEYNGKVIRFTVSQGIAQYSGSIKNHEVLLSMADEALYQSKENGRNCCTVYQGNLPIEEHGDEGAGAGAGGGGAGGKGA